MRWPKYAALRSLEKEADRNVINNVFGLWFRDDACLGCWKHFVFSHLRHARTCTFLKTKGIDFRENISSSQQLYWILSRPFFQTVAIIWCYSGGVEGAQHNYMVLCPLLFKMSFWQIKVYRHSKHEDISSQMFGQEIIWSLTFRSCFSPRELREMAMTPPPRVILIFDPLPVWWVRLTNTVVTQYSLWLSRGLNPGLLRPRLGCIIQLAE